MNWSFSIEDAIEELIAEELYPQTIEKALTNMGFGACNELYAPTSATHLLLVHSQSEYNFTSNDLEWLECAATVFSYETDNGENIFFVEMTCNIDDYYVSCAAIVKLFNIAFPAENLFVFRISDNVAFGMARELDRTIPHNFAVTGLINRINMYSYEELIYDFTSTLICDLPQLIISSSPQEQYEERNYDSTHINPDYLSFLDEFESFYGADTSLEKARFLNDAAVRQVSGNYKTACEELKAIVEDNSISSYEDLDAAEAAEEKTRHVQVPNSNEGESRTLDEPILGFSKDAFNDAEQMLKEMLGKDK